MMDYTTICLTGVFDMEHADNNTLQVRGVIGDIPILILVDSGASHKLYFLASCVSFGSLC